MSRICVKNLPKYATEERLRDFFSQKGEVTDAKLMRTTDGKSRQFGFVGFRTEHEAEAAIKYFNNSYMDTLRITCEIARKVGDSNIPRPWSRHSQKGPGHLDKVEETVTGPKDLKPVNAEIRKHSNADESDDPQLQEFLEIMQPRSKSKLWANDTLAPPSLKQSKVPVTNKTQMIEGHEEKLDEDHSELENSEEDENRSSEKQDDDRAKKLAHDEVLSDMDYFKSRVTKKWSDSESSDEDSSDVDTNDADEDSGGSGDDQDISHQVPVVERPKASDSEPAANNLSSAEVGIIKSMDRPSSLTEDVLESGRLFIRNLPYTATEEDLKNHFSKYGSISQVHIVVDKNTKRSKGIAYVLFALPESAARPLEEMDNSTFQGRLLHVMPAKQKNIPNKESEAHLPKSFKQQKDAERKASEASGSTRAWNTLFMRPDTIVENITRKYGVSKTELLDRESNDVAVRVALGETQVIAETKKALSSAGINIASLEEFAAAGKTDGLKRSNHVVLVKNLPYSSSENELADMFGKFGSLEKVILPPTRTLALVIFLEPAEARTAFKSLSYKRYKDAPLYLEWAPDNILSQTQKIGDDTVNDDIDSNRALLEQQVNEITDADVDPDRTESRQVYVKNLNFKTSDEALKKHFSQHVKKGKILSARVIKHVKKGKNLSSGFGFVEFDSVDTAMGVCKDLQGTNLDGYALRLQLCHTKEDAGPKKSEDGKSLTKLHVKNVAFEATEKDLRQLFSPFGQIKSLRLPKKIGNHQGYAFVEYVTKQESRNALQALSNTHLYGRHLVLERAKEDENVDELRAKTAAKFTDDSSSKLSKKRKHMTVLDEGNVKFQKIAD